MTDRAQSFGHLFVDRIEKTPNREAFRYHVGDNWKSISWAQTKVRYFVYAFLYVVFAVDAVYLFPWAHVLRSADIGTASLVEMGIFIGVIVLGLAHAARRGLLRWV